MLKQVVHGALTSGSMLGNEAQEGNHGKAAVLDLLQLQLVDVRSGARSKTKGVKGTTRISRHASTLESGLEAQEGALLSLASRILHVLPAFDLNKIVQEEHHHEERVEGNGRVFLGDFASDEPLRHVEDASLGEDVGDQHASDTKHSPAAVLKLSVTVPAIKNMENDFIYMVLIYEIQRRT